MTHAIAIYDGTTNKSLSSSGCMLVDYLPQASEWDPEKAVWKSVSETVEFAITVASAALVRAALAEVERILGGGRRRATTGRGRRIWLLFQPDGDSEWRVEIQEWRLVPMDGAMQSIGQGFLQLRLHIVRAGLWEGPRTQVGLTNGNGTNNTSGLTVYNHDDATGSHDNWVEIAGSSVTGSAPALVELSLANANAALTYYDNLYISNNPYGTAMTSVVDTELAVGGYGTITANVAAANGNYLAITAAGVHRFRWTIPTATLDLLRGAHVRILCKFFSIASAAREVRLTLYDWGGLTPLTSAQVTYTGGAGASFLHDCGSVPLPPAPYASNWKDVVLEVAVISTASELIGVDFLSIMPCEANLYRHLALRGGIDVGEFIVDDGPEQVAYATEGGGLKYPIVTERTNPIQLEPGITQRIKILLDGFGATIEQKFTVKVWIRPRRFSF